MARMEERICDACSRPFTVPTGSLRRVCRDEECLSTRRISAQRADAEERRERDRIRELRTDDRVRAMWPEVEAVLLEASTLGAPGRDELIQATRRAGTTKGAAALRLALISLAAIALRWASMLPRSNVIEPSMDRVHVRRRGRPKGVSSAAA